MAAPESVRPSQAPILRREPLGRVFDLAQRRSRIYEMVAAALLLHGVAAADAATHTEGLYDWARMVKYEVSDRLASMYEVDIIKEDPPPPPPEAPKDEPEPPKPDDTPPPPPPQEAPKEAKDTPPAAPQPAQAGALLTQAPDPNEPLDMTNSMVSGNGTTFAGGVTSANGHGGPTYNTHAQVNGAPAGTGTAPGPAAGGVDKSRPLKRSDESECRNFPPEADRDSQQVRVRVTVDASGSISGLQVLADPGEGFGREARKCVAGFHFAPALDRNGTPIAATRDFNITFTRQ